MGQGRLDNQERLEQCRRIKQMVKKVHDTGKYKDDYYAGYHHWELNEPIGMDEIEKFEKKAGIELPIEYVYFVTQVGNGGASPGTRLDELDMEWAEDEKIGVASKQLERVFSEKEWEELFGGHTDEPGAICLCAMDLTYQAYLVTAGPMKGKIVYMDWDGDCPPMWPKGLPDILTWYEQFFSEKLAGYNINPTWRFMWQQPGDEDALMEAFGICDDIECKKEILWSFQKFSRISDGAYDFLAGIKEEGLADEAEGVMRAFSNEERKKRHNKKNNGKNL